MKAAVQIFWNLGQVFQLHKASTLKYKQYEYCEALPSGLSRDTKTTNTSIPPTNNNTRTATKATKSEVMRKKSKHLNFQVVNKDYVHQLPAANNKHRIKIWKQKPHGKQSWKTWQKSISAGT